MVRRTETEALLATAGVMFILGISELFWFGRGLKGWAFIALGLLILVRFAWTKKKRPNA